jgi:hypothetical protein
VDEEQRIRPALAVLAMVGAGLYVVVIVVMPLLDPNLDIKSAHPEDYAAGRLGMAVNLSYAALAVGLAALAGALLDVEWKAIVADLLLLLAAILCAALAIEPVGVARMGVVLIPVVALAAAPLTTALLLGRLFGRWKTGLTLLAALVAVAFIALVVSPSSLGGIVNRVFDALAGAWVAAAGAALWARFGEVKAIPV